MISSEATEEEKDWTDGREEEGEEERVKEPPPEDRNW